MWAGEPEGDDCSDDYQEDRPGPGYESTRYESPTG